MNRQVEQSIEVRKEFRSLCTLFGSFWRKCSLNPTPKVHIIEAHLADIMDLHGRLGIFSENPAETEHILNKNWDYVLKSMKTWEKMVSLKQLRRNSGLIEGVYDAIESFQQTHIRESGNKRTRESPQHESLEHITQRIQAFAEDDEADRDLQFAGMNIEEGNDQVDDNTMRMDTDDI